MISSELSKKVFLSTLFHFLFSAFVLISLKKRTWCFKSRSRNTPFQEWVLLRTQYTIPGKNHFLPVIKRIAVKEGGCNMQIFRLEIEVSTYNNHHCCSLLQLKPYSDVVLWKDFPQCRSFQSEKTFCPTPHRHSLKSSNSTWCYRDCVT